ncbi:hypothetical protein C8R45DRAFT_1103072 [Mycena sanguinolenta]|nr:hypothetical protein C8R45DRAFT_1103072 [Mycena sanguinolenta]
MCSPGIFRARDGITLFLAFPPPPFDHHRRWFPSAYYHVSQQMLIWQPAPNRSHISPDARALQCVRILVLALRRSCTGAIHQGRVLKPHRWLARPKRTVAAEEEDFVSGASISSKSESWETKVRVDGTFGTASQFIEVRGETAVAREPRRVLDCDHVDFYKLDEGVNFKRCVIILVIDQVVATPQRSFSGARIRLDRLASSFSPSLGQFFYSVGKLEVVENVRVKRTSSGTARLTTRILHARAPRSLSHGAETVWETPNIFPVDSASHGGST